MNRVETSVIQNSVTMTFANNIVEQKKSVSLGHTIIEIAFYSEYIEAINVHPIHSLF